MPASSEVPLYFAGACGGAGVSTLAQLFPGTATVGRGWPYPPSGVAPTVLVTRSHHAGLLAVQNAVTEWASRAVEEHVALVGIAVIDDGPSVPKELASDIPFRVSGATELPDPVPMWRLPWVEEWRRGRPPRLESAPRMYRKVYGRLQDLVPALAGAQSLTQHSTY